MYISTVWEHEKFIKYFITEKIKMFRIKKEFAAYFSAFGTLKILLDVRYDFCYKFSSIVLTIEKYDPIQNYTLYIFSKFFFTISMILNYFVTL